MLKKIAIIDKDEQYMNTIAKKLSENNFKTYLFSSIKEFLKNKYSEYYVVIINDEFKTKEKNNSNSMILFEKKMDAFLNDNKYIYKYQSIDKTLKDIYEYKECENKPKNENIKKTNNVVIYNASVNEYTNKIIGKIFKERKENNKFVWNFEMFSNENDEYMDINVASKCVSLLDNDSFQNKLKKIDDNIYTFGNVKNQFDFLELEIQNYEQLYNKLIAINFRYHLFVLTGNINKLYNRILCNSSSIIIIYDDKDEIKKEKIKKYIIALEGCDLNDINIVEFKITYNDKKDSNYVSNIDEVIC